LTIEQPIWNHSGATGAAVRLVATQLEESERAFERLLANENGKADSALHDFRVALRRLRSTLRAYAPWLGRAGDKKLRRRLAILSDKTNRGRDAEVQTAWIRASMASLPDASREAAETILGCLGKERRIDPHKLQAHLEPIAKKLRHRLENLDARDGAFSPVLRVLARRHAEELMLELDRIEGADDRDAVHAARIATKRLRYLVDPMTPCETLASLQDVLGELHDAHVLDEALSEIRPDDDENILAKTIDELLRRNDERAADSFESLAQGWLGGRSKALLADVIEGAERALAEF
jgi:CHAD domain-containing protein